MRLSSLGKSGAWRVFALALLVSVVVGCAPTMRPSEAGADVLRSDATMDRVEMGCAEDERRPCTCASNTEGTSVCTNGVFSRCVCAAPDVVMQDIVSEPEGADVRDVATEEVFFEDAPDVVVQDTIEERCVPQCEGRVCGDDGCGGVCGVCPMALLCNRAGLCVPPPECSEGSSRVCYSAATGRGVGRCRDGMQSCRGGAWESCMGEVLPAAEEVCNNTIDDDCDGSTDEGCAAPMCFDEDLGSAVGDRLRTGTTVGRRNIHSSPGCNAGNAAPEVVFRWTAPSTGTFTFTTEGSSFDTILYARRDSCSGPEVDCNDDTIGTASWITLSVTAGVPVFLLVDGFGSASGNYVLNIRAGAPMCVPRCALRNCGTDSCGGVCGTCTTGNICSALGDCLPTNPFCGHLSTATRCGGMLCPANSGCISGSGVVSRCECLPGFHAESCAGVPCSTTACTGYEYRCVRDLCVPGCGTRVCGADGCGGSCGSCASAATCSASGQCTLQSGYVSYRGRFTYEWFEPSAGRTDWIRAGVRAGVGFQVFSMAGNTVLGTAVTESDGGFTVPIAATPGAVDRIVVVAGTAPRGDGVYTLLVASPELPSGTHPTRATESLSGPRAWSWSFASNALPPDGALRAIDEAAGAGAAFLFSSIRNATATGQALVGGGRVGRSMIVWMQPGVSWECGTCVRTYAPPDTVRRTLGSSFGSELWHGGAMADREWWSESVHYHEVGHWLMGSFGVSPAEAQEHYISRAYSPGIAWSEGFADWYSMSGRGAPALYVDKQDGVMFWYDFANRLSSSSIAWPRPSPMGGLLQDMSEGEVAALLWALEPNPTQQATMYQALVSPRMMFAPFERGYRNPSGVNVPVFPDFLDALVCAGFSRTRMTSVLQPNYPYDPNTARCR